MNADKRWLDRAQRWVAPGEVFSKTHFTVAELEELPAKRFVEQHHYSGTFPAAQYRVGLFHRTTLVGCAVFSVPAQQAVVPCYLGVEKQLGTELGRFVCLPSVAYNGETWFLARAQRLLREAKPLLQGIVSYADPLERYQGTVIVKPAHYGTIYQASNATYVGRSEARWLTVAPDGRVFNRRSLDKLKRMERGWEYVARQLLAYGVDARRVGESGAEWVKRVVVAPLFTRVKHPGNLTYVFALHESVKAHAGAGLPYVKRSAA